MTGDPEAILNEPNTVVITESMARRYFQDDDPMDKGIEIYKNFYRVKGIMQDIPYNSHLQFDILISFKSPEPELNVRKRSLDFPLYIKVSPEADGSYLSKLTEVIQVIHRKHYYEAGIFLESGLQQLTDIHLRSTDLTATLDHPGDTNDLVILFSLALFILLITLSNYINLLTANNKIRIRDMGMRIVLGAQKRQLLSQLISESVLIGLAAAFIAVVLLELNLRPFSFIVGSPITLSFISMAGFFIVFILMAGLLSYLS